jgi:hypothetical protein
VQYSKRGIPGTLPKLEEMLGVMCKSGGDYFEGDSPIGPK